MPQHTDRYVELVTGGEVVSALNPIPTSGGGGGGGGAVTVADGADVNAGATGDSAVTTDVAGTMSGKLRGLVAHFVSLLARLPGALTVGGNFKAALVESTVSQLVKATPAALTDAATLSITSGGVSQQVFAANAARCRLVVQNQSTGLLFLNFGAVASAVPPSIRLEPYDTWTELSTCCTNQSVNIFGATTGQAFSAKESV